MSPRMTQFYSFLWLSNIPLCICTTSSLSISSTDEHLGYFHVLAVVNSAAMNTGVHVFLELWFFSGYMLRSGTAMSYGSSVSSF